MTHNDKWTELEKLAKAATPGPWNYDAGNVELEQAETRKHIAFIGASPSGELEQFRRVAHWMEDGEFIAASHPQVILQLIALARSEAVLRTIIGSIFDTTILAGPGREEKLQAISRQARHALAESERLREVMK